MAELANVEWLSPSACSTYLQCPLKFKYEKIDKIPTKPSEAMLRGRLVHGIIEHLMRRPPLERDHDAARSLATELWKNEYAQEAEVFNFTQEQARAFKWEAWWCVDNYFKIEDPRKVVPAGMEKWVKGTIGKGKVRGIIDRYDTSKDGVHIIDYKTGKKPGRAEWADPQIFQLTVYSILLEQEIDKPVHGVSLYYLGDGNKAKYTVTPKRRGSAEATVNNIREGIDERVANNSFEPKPSKLCDWCAFKPICPAWNTTAT